MDFKEYLDELADSSVRLKVSNLARLSRLNHQQSEDLRHKWPLIDARRRRRVVQELTDLAEDNVELNFDQVFIRGLDDEDAAVRLASVRGLSEHEHPSLIARLLDLLEHDPSAGVRAEAALALGRYALLAELGRLRPSYFLEIEVGLKRVLGDLGEIEEVRARALEAIGPHDAPWVRQSIREAYESGVRRLKVSAVYAMGRSCDTRWLPLLTRELNSEEAEVRYEAAIACGALGDEGAVPHLIPLTHDPDEEVRQVTIAALSEIGGIAAKRALEDLADNPAASTREAAVAALHELEFEEDPFGFKFRS